MPFAFAPALRHRAIRPPPLGASWLWEFRATELPPMHSPPIGPQTTPRPWRNKLISYEGSGFRHSKQVVLCDGSGFRPATQTKTYFTKVPAQDPPNTSYLQGFRLQALEQLRFLSAVREGAGGRGACAIKMHPVHFPRCAMFWVRSVCAVTPSVTLARLVGFAHLANPPGSLCQGAWVSVPPFRPIYEF